MLWPLLTSPTVPDLWTYDVFDTLLTRVVATPRDVFSMVALRLARDGVIVPSRRPQLAHDRVVAEERTRWLHLEPTLSTIYRVMQQDLGWPSDVAAAAEAAELDLERRLVRAVPEVGAHLEAVRARGDAVGFVSDMYLPSSYLSALLVDRKVRPEVSAEPVYVSCEQAGSKADGRLWSQLICDSAAGGWTLHHVGDNWHGDFQVPREQGVDARLFTSCHLSRRESALKDRQRSSTYLSLLVGAGRTARVRRWPDDPDLLEPAAGVAAPLLTAYVTWVLKRAAALGLDRLYFVSRDGQALLAVARELGPHVAPNVQLRYLYGSRACWHRAAQAVADADLSWVVDGSSPMTAQLVAARLGVPPAELPNPAPGPWAREEWLRIIHTPAVQGAVRQAGAAPHDAMLCYLEQEDLLGNAQWALVDVGWRGRQYAALVDVLTTTGAEPGGCFLLGLTEGSPLGKRRGWVEAWLYDEREDPVEARRRHAAAPLVELFCAGTHGGVRGYRRQGHLIAPVLTAGRNQPVVDWGSEQLQALLVDHAKLVAEHLVDVDAAEDVRPALADALLDLWNNPTHVEAWRYGSFPYDDDLESAHHLPLAQPYTLADLLRIGRGKPLPRSAANWPAASLRRTHPVLRPLVAGVPKVRWAAQRVRRRIAPG